VFTDESESQISTIVSKLKDFLKVTGSGGAAYTPFGH